MNTSIVGNLFEGRSRQIDYERLPDLCYVGNYTRSLPVSITRMIENAYDWAHLPFVHSGTFHSIELVEEGEWGWRALVGTAKSAGTQKNMLELLVDAENGYWATTVLSGFGTGVEIHTQATKVSARQIDIDVRFYLPQKENWLKRTLTHSILKKQYKNLYDEDNELMLGRQTAIDETKRWAQKSSKVGEMVAVGEVAKLNKDQTHIVEASSGRYCVVFKDGKWLAYSAICPHQLGDLSNVGADHNGVITCPWHGYKFDIFTGANMEHKCANLHRPDVLFEEDTLILRI